MLSRGCDGQSVDTSGFTVLPLSLTKAPAHTCFGNPGRIALQRKASSVASAVQHFAAGEQVEWKTLGRRFCVVMLSCLEKVVTKAS